jgi:nucleotide-binding universal stress UspA family protein
VVGVDACLVSWIAVQWAASLAGWLDAEVIAAHALRPGLPRADVPAGSIGAQVAVTLERDWCAPLRAAAVPYRLVVREGSPVDVLQEVVEAEAPELVVTGRHFGAQERGWRSTSLGMLASPRVPTLVVPEPIPDVAMAAPLGGRDVAVRRILVGVDGSAPSLRALDWAVRLAAASDGDVVAVSTIEEVPVFPLGPATAESSAGETDAPARAAVMLARACAPARARGAHVHTISRRGPPVTVLVRMATLLHADLVAVGIRGMDGPDHPTLGHVSRRLVCRSPVPALLAP